MSTFNSPVRHTERTGPLIARSHAENLKFLITLKFLNHSKS